MFFVFVNEIWCTSIKSSFHITTVAVELKSYSEIKRYNQYKKLGVWSPGWGQVMVSNWVYSCLATLVFCGVTVNWIHCDTTEIQCGQTGIYPVRHNNSPLPRSHTQIFILFISFISDFNSTATVVILNADFIDVHKILLTKTKKHCIFYSLL